MKKTSPVKQSLPTEYEKRVKAISLAIQHSRNCQGETLIKLADKIYAFINGRIAKPKTDEE